MIRRMKIYEDRGGAEGMAGLMDAEIRKEYNGFTSVETVHYRAINQQRYTNLHDSCRYGCAGRDRTAHTQIASCLGRYANIMTKSYS